MSFTLRLFHNNGDETIENVTHFVADDASGNFCLLSGHDYFMTILNFGLARFQVAGMDPEYIALPGGFIQFQNNELSLHTRRYWRGKDYSQMNATLHAEEAEATKSLLKIKSNLDRIEESMMRRLLDLERN